MSKQFLCTGRKANPKPKIAIVANSELLDFHRQSCHTVAFSLDAQFHLTCSDDNHGFPFNSVAIASLVQLFSMHIVHNTTQKARSTQY